MSMSLNDAYDFVRRKKSNISPNFNFMGQLLDFERQLNPPSPQRCTCHLSSSSLPTAAPGNEDAEKLALIPFMRLSIEEKDDEENVESMSPSTESTLLPGGGCMDSGVPSSVSLSPSSLASSPAANSTTSSSGGSGVKRLRTLVCRCQASLSQCHFTTPTTTASPYPNPWTFPHHVFFTSLWPVCFSSSWMFQYPKTKKHNSNFWFPNPSEPHK